MARPGASASAVGDIPEGPLVEILSRVPAKSVCRFKCVSSAWRDLIADPNNRKKLPQAMSGLFCMTPATSEAAAAGDANKESSYGFSFVDLTTGSADLDVDPRFSFLTELPEMKVLLFRDSCNGLVLFEHREELPGRLGYIACNPTTKEWKTVPNCGSATLLTYPHLAFDPKVSCHFNLVQFQVEDDEESLSVHAYSSETGTWSEDQIDEEAEVEGELLGWRHLRFNLADPTPCPFVNGFLHMLVWHQDELKIVAVDVQGKARKLIPVPHASDGRFFMCYFCESQGQLHYLAEEILGARHEEKRYKMSIFALQDYDAEEWVLKGTLYSHEVFGAENKIEFEVVDIHQDRNMVFLTHPVENKLVAYDMDHEEVSTVATFDENNELMGTARYVQCY